MAPPTPNIRSRRSVPLPLMYSTDYYRFGLEVKFPQARSSLFGWSLDHHGLPTPSDLRYTSWGPF